jgi:hypothetical protein
MKNLNQSINTDTQITEQYINQSWQEKFDQLREKLLSRALTQSNKSKAKIAPKDPVFA